MFDYIYSDSKRKFSFIKLPSVLFTDERFNALTNDMKLLYALMLDRVSLSVKNGWVDSKGRVYISFPLAEIEERLHVASQKASRLLKALEKAGLIERVRQGLGKPDRIYVKDCCKGVAESDAEVDLPAPIPQSTVAESTVVETVEKTEISVVPDDDFNAPMHEESQPEPVKNTVQNCENAQVTLYNNLKSVRPRDGWMGWNSAKLTNSLSRRISNTTGSRTCSRSHQTSRSDPRVRSRNLTTSWRSWWTASAPAPRRSVSAVRTWTPKLSAASS